MAFNIIIIGSPVASHVDWNKCTLVNGGWTIHQDSHGFSIEGQLYSNDPINFPRRGDTAPLDGPCAVDADFKNYHVDEVEATPLTSAGPFVCSVILRSTVLENNKESSLLREKRALLEIRNLKVNSKRVKGANWTGKKTVPCQAADVTWHRRGTLDGIPPRHVLVDLPAWAGGGKNWLIHSATAEHIRDNDGVSTLRKLHVVFYKPCHGSWDADDFDKITWDDI